MPIATPDPIAPAAASILGQMLDERDLILVTGKGGTGKSTVVAALAELAARRRGRALAVEMAAHPRLPALLAPGSGVDSLNIDAEKVVKNVLGRLLHLPALVGGLLGNRIIRLFIRTSPAVREMVMLDELRFLVDERAASGCPVLLDLPATGHALSFLDTPRAVRSMLRVGPLAQLAARVEQLLLDQRRTELVLVALPEELPVNETIELAARAAAQGLGSRTVLVNQVPAAPMPAHDLLFLDAIEQGGDAALGRYADAARHILAGAVEARAQIARLRAAIQLPVIELPELPAADPRACVAALAEILAP